MNDNLSQLKDIKPYEYIDINLIPYYIGIGLVLLFVIIFVALYIFLIYKNKKPTKRQLAIKYLKDIDLNRDMKDIAYDFTLYAYECLNPKYEDEYQNIVDKLEIYKYKKDIPDIDNDIIEDIKGYIKVRV